jgi:hypothetical protein
MALYKVGFCKVNDDSSSLVASSVSISLDNRLVVVRVVFNVDKVKYFSRNVCRKGTMSRKGMSPL